MNTKNEGKALNVIAIRKKVVLPSHTIGLALGLPFFASDTYKKEWNLVILCVWLDVNKEK